MKIWHISDTHMSHRDLKIPLGVDVVIHSGDATNSLCAARNHAEAVEFMNWLSQLKIRNKIFVAGNHETSFVNLFDTQALASEGITYLRETSTEVDGVKIWGSPMTPTYGSWAFMTSRGGLNKYWQGIPEDTDIVVTHGPPQGILDSTMNMSNEIEFAGCSALMKRVTLIAPALHAFGHIHNRSGILNAGVRTVAGLRTVFSNGSCSTDGKRDFLTSHGNLFDVTRSSSGALRVQKLEDWGFE